MVGEVEDLDPGRLRRLVPLPPPWAALGAPASSPPAADALPANATSSGSRLGGRLRGRPGPAVACGPRPSSNPHRRRQSRWELMRTPSFPSSPPRRPHTSPCASSPPQALPTLSGTSPPAARPARASTGDGYPQGRSCWMFGLEDVSPSMVRLEELKNKMSFQEFGSKLFLQESASARGGDAAFGDLDWPGPSEEVKAWVSATLASLPCKRKGGAASVPMPLPLVLSCLPRQPSKQGTRPLESAPVTAAGDGGAPALVQGEEEAEEEASSLGQEDDEQPQQQTEGEQVVERLRRQSEGAFENAEVSRIRAAFSHFRESGTNEVHKDQLREILMHLGFTMTDPQDVLRIADEVSVYCGLDFEDLLLVTEKFSAFEQTRFRTIFDQFDEDGSGQLNVDELQQFMVWCGFTPLRAMVREALALVDVDNTRSLNFPELVHLLTIYRRNEGFTSGEVAQIQDLCKKTQHPEETEADESAKDAALYPEELPNVLVKFYGPQSKERADEIGRQRARPLATDASIAPLPPSSEAPTAAAGAAAGAAARAGAGLRLPETLLWARLLREKEFESYREKFDLHDQDGSGSIDRSELVGVISDLGFSLTKATVDEFVELSEDENGGEFKDGKLDFDEFVNLMLGLRKRDGFSTAETAELRRVFERFDENHNEEIDVLELSDMLRYVGHTTKLEEVHAILAKVDLNQSGTLDIQEFFRLMRLHREEELEAVRKSFKRHYDATLDGIPASCLPMALAGLGLAGGQPPPMEELSAASSRQPIKAMTALKNNLARKVALPRHSAADLQALQARVLDLDQFIEAVDRARAAKVAQQRRCAGFSQTELARFRATFNAADADGSGAIEAQEIGALLESIGVSLPTVTARFRVLKEIEKARDAAIYVGVEDVGEGCAVTFWVFVQLLRIYYKRDDKQVLDREARAMDQTNFSAGEVEQFRDIFLTWFEKDKAFTAERASNAPQGAVAFTLGPGGATAVVRQEEVKELTKECVRRLLRSLNLALSAEDRSKLERKIIDFGMGGKVDFPDFLRLMRWLLDINLADIHGTVAKAAKL